MDKLKDVIGYLDEKRIETLTATVFSGVILISLGIALMGREILPYIGSRLVILGSGIFYISLILLVFLID